jgi:glucosamine--fructose-6-phosphate aminotransferase (isomerizing)
MSGIVGILGRFDVSERLLSALGRLEYRGYDSAGPAVMNAQTLLVSSSYSQAMR